jgi:hypothetical protein
LNRRAAIEGLRLADEEAQRKAEAAEKAAELERLRAEAREEVRRLEARANGKAPAGDLASQAVDWWDDGGEKLEGTLTKIDCLGGRQFRLEVKDDHGAAQRLLIRDPGKIAVSGGEMTFACGAQKPRSLTIHYKPAKDAAKGTAGEVLSIDLK